MKFEILVEYLAVKFAWNEEDKNAWSKDLFEQPELTIKTLRALAHSWCRGGGGVLQQKDWVAIDDWGLDDD